MREEPFQCVASHPCLTSFRSSPPLHPTPPPHLPPQSDYDGLPAKVKEQEEMVTNLRVHGGHSAAAARKLEAEMRKLAGLREDLKAAKEEAEVTQSINQSANQSPPLHAHTHTHFSAHSIGCSLHVPFHFPGLSCCVTGSRPECVCMCVHVCVCGSGRS